MRKLFYVMQGSSDQDKTASFIETLKKENQKIVYIKDIMSEEEYNSIKRDIDKKFEIADFAFRGKLLKRLFEKNPEAQIILTDVRDTGLMVVAEKYFKCEIGYIFLEKTTKECIHIYGENYEGIGEKLLSGPETN